MIEKFKKAFAFEKSNKLYASLAAIVVGLLFGLLLLVVVNPLDAFPAFINLFTAGFSNIGNVIFYATPIILTGLSIAFAFKTGLFNIGATGQLLIGGFVAIYVGIHWTFLGSFTWVVAVLMSLLAGGLWALLPAVLRLYRGVHEVVTSIMMNYIGLYLVNFLVKKTVFFSDQNHSMPVSKTIPKFGLDLLFPGSNIQGGFLLAIIAVIIIFIILNKTSFGFELKSVGSNIESSKYAGINIKSKSISSFVIAGMLAGLAGAVIYLTNSGTYINVDNNLPSQGFMGISVALLAFNNPVGVVFSGLFFGYLTIGGESMQLYNFSPEIIDVITGAIIYCSALSLLFIRVLQRFIKQKRKDVDEL